MSRPAPPLMAGVAELAGLFGIETSFVDIAGVRRHATLETLVAVLSAAGSTIGGPGEITEAIRAKRAERCRTPLAPVTAVLGEGSPSVQLTLPHGRDPAKTTVWVEFEDGTVVEKGLAACVRRPIKSDVVDGVRYDRYALALAALPGSAADWGYGYHRLRLEGPGASVSTLLILAPRCPTPDRGWGVFQPIAGLRTERSHGVGTYTDLAALAQWTRSAGSSFVGTLPLYPQYLDDPVEISPYLPVSRMAWNDLFIDPGAVPELALSPEAKEAMQSAEYRAAMEHPRGSDLIDYPSVNTALHSVLAPMADTLFSGGSTRRDELEAFVHSHPVVAEYAQFRAGQESDGPVLGGEDRRTRLHLYAQWLADEQLAAVGPGLYLDLPVGVHPDGFDQQWAPGAFVSGIQVGAPPDDFFPGGQGWAFRPLHPDVVRSQEYRYPIAYLRRAMARASLVRIDHVMGLRRLYWIPDGFDASHGAYVRYPLDEMTAIVALEAHRSGTAVVGEDLGTVPAEVHTAMGDSGMLRSWVLEFVATAADPLPAPPEAALASIGTHDLPRFAAFFDGDDLDDLVDRGAQSSQWAEERRTERSAWRRALSDRIAKAHGGADDDGDLARQGLAACLAHLADSPACLVGIDLEDLWLERRPINRPGSGAELPNWRERSARTLDEAMKDPFVEEMLAVLKRARRPSYGALR